MTDPLPSFKNIFNPAAPGQKSLWLTQKLNPRNYAYNVARAFYFSGDLNVDIIERAFFILLERHPSLKSVFENHDGIIFQRANDSVSFFQKIDAYHFGKKEIEEYCEKEAKLPFDLEQGPLIRVKLLICTDFAVLILVIHHIVIDLWSEIILSKEFIEIYQAEHMKREINLPHLKVTYEDFSKEEDRKALSPTYPALLDFWKSNLKGTLPILNLPFSKHRPSIQTFSGDEIFFEIDDEEASKIRNLASKSGVTVYALLISLFQFLFIRYTNDSEVIIGSTTSGRSHSKYKNIVGYFVNPIALRLSSPDEQIFLEFLKKNGQKIENALKHKDMPFSFLLDELNLKRDPKFPPLFQVMFNYVGKLPFWQTKQEIPLGNKESAKKLVIEPIKIKNKTAQFDIVVNVALNGKRLEFRWEYNTDLFECTSIERMIGHYRHILRQVIEDPSINVNHISLINDQEKEQILKESLGQKKEFLAPSNIYHSFEIQSQKTPHSQALRDKNEKISYFELYERVSMVSSLLIEKGLKEGDIAAIIMPISIDLITAILAVLRIGAAYLPIDPTYPSERIQFMLKDSNARCLFSEKYSDKVDPTLGFSFESLIKLPNHGILNKRRAVVNPHNLAYVIYTSGSTGRPKGVMIPHYAIANYIHWAIQAYVDETISSFPLFSSIAFDLTLTSIFVPLSCGKSIQLCGSSSPEENLRNLLKDRATEFCKLTPPHLSIISELLKELDAPSSLCKFIVGGEDFTVRLADSVSQLLGDQALFYNEYGPTEASVGCMTYLYNRQLNHRKSVPIGGPIDNIYIYILDSELKLVPTMVPGELYIGGAGLAWGYLNRPDITAEKFIPNPFKPAERMYKTGDLAQRLEGGSIEYLGRLDDQVKIHGFRIELGEIEQSLRNYSGIKDALVIEHKIENHSPKLCAYMISDGNIDLEDLKNTLAKQLPHYMVPSFIIPLLQFPLSPNGKVDRKQLPAPTFIMSENDRHEPPKTVLEKLILKIWSDILLLNEESIGVNDHFFDLNGDSIKAIQISSRLRREGFNCDVQDLFLFVTIRSLAEKLSRASSQIEIDHSILVENDHHNLEIHQKYENRVETIYPLTAIQEGILFHSYFDKDTLPYFEQMTCKFKGVIDEGYFKNAVGCLAGRHELLRSHLHQCENGTVKCVVFNDKALEMNYQDISTLSLKQQQDLVIQYQDQDRRRGFDLFKDSLLRVALFKIKANEAIFVWSAHHIILDGWSLGILCRDFSTYYLSIRTQLPPVLPTLGLYREFIYWNLNQDRGQAKEYWKNYLKDFEESPLVLGLPTSTVSYERQNHSFLISPEQMQQLRSLAAASAVTVNTVFQSIWSVLLHKWNGKEDILFGHVVAIRPTEIENLEHQVGLFINTLPVRVRFSFYSDWQTLFKQIQQGWMASQKHAFLSLSDIQECVSVENKLINHLVVFANYPSIDAHSELQLMEFNIFEQTNYPFTIYIKPSNEGCDIDMVYNGKAFRSEEICEIESSFRVIIEQLIGNCHALIGAIETVTEEKAKLLLFGQGETTSKVDKSLSQLFEDQAKKNPSHTAIIEGDKEYSYCNVDQKSNQIAHYLRKKGVSAGSIVGLHCERSSQVILIILGILKAGGAYLPLDIEMPLERLEVILRESDCQWLFVNQMLPISFNGEILLTDPKEWEEETVYSLPYLNQPRELAYIIYTSGSTGIPKGVLIEQESIVNRLINLQKMYPCNGEDAFLFKTSYAFDVSCTELFSWFIGGGKVVVLGAGLEKEPNQIAEIIERHRITHLNFSPSMLKLFLHFVSEKTLHSILQQIKFLFSAGEALTLDIQQRFKEFHSKAFLINLYGPTECTVYATGTKYKNTSIGVPLPNLQAYILDEDLNLVPKWVPGELYLSGSGLARGYLNRPELTAERFIPSPFQNGQRMYKTGDRVRWSSEGNIEFIGRKDSQVKIRGFRIEIGEIEQSIYGLNLIKEAVVITERLHDELVLIAYYVAKESTLLPSERLKAELKKKVPSYMVPSFFVALEEMPHKSSGKIDRKRLPPLGDFEISSTLIPPLRKKLLSLNEQKLVELWATVLEVPLESIGMADNFFDRGGHSLKAMRLLAQVRQQWNIHLSIRDFFENPTIEFLISSLLDNTHLTTNHLMISPIGQRTSYPLTPPQQRLFVLHRMFPLSLNYNLPGAFLIEGEPQIVRLNEAYRQLIERHESLRTAFIMDEERPEQLIASEFDSEIVELNWVGKTVEEAILLFIRPFDLNKPPLIRSLLAKLEEQKYLLLFDAHHIAVDGTSLAILAKEFLQIYAGMTLPSLLFQYKDYACALENYYQTPHLENQKKFWMNYLRGDLPVLNMPADFARKSSSDFNGERVTVKWEGSIFELLKKFAMQEKVTLNALILALLNVLLFRYTNQTDLLIGLPVAGRHLHPDLDKLVGMFINTLVLRAQPNGSKIFRDFLKEVFQDCVSIYENQDVPFEYLMDALNVPREENRHPLFDIFFAYQNIPKVQLELNSLQMSSLSIAPKEIKFDLSIEVYESEAEMVWHLDYSTQLFRRSTIERFMQHLQILTDHLLHHPNSCLSECNFNLQEETARLLFYANHVPIPYPHDKSIIDLWEEQVKSHPHHIAVRTADESLTYEQFAKEVYYHAEKLIDKKIGPGSIVALISERSIEMLVGIYAILKAGAAYLPLDPSLPVERKEFILQSSQAACILAKNSDAIPPLFLNKALPLERESALNLGLINVNLHSPDSLAYVLFTSGSTGEPKGVLIPHRAVINRLHWMQRQYPIQGEDVLFQKTPITFDVSVWELFWWAFEGASVFLLAPEEEKNPEVMIHILKKSDVTVMHFVPSMLNAFLDYVLTLEKRDETYPLRYVFASGEALHPAQVEKFYHCFPDASLINLYGPTEATVDVSYFNCAKGISYDVIPIGKPIQNISLYILDPFKNMQPIGIPGELHIGGIGLAWGYLGKPDLTAEKFVPNPYKPGDRLYKTGDLSRWLSNGEIEYLGRLDHQVKIRGMRIELGEIESVLLMMSSISQAVVITKALSTGHQLVAYVVLHRNQKMTDTEIKAFLQSKLPAYMIPSHVLILDQFPLTSSGKANRKLLPDPIFNHSTQSTISLSPENLEIAAKLAVIWRQLLGKGEVGFSDNFFELGGDSILAIQAISRARSLGIDLSLQQLLRHQNIADIVQAIVEDDGKKKIMIDQSRVSGSVRLTPIQKWFFENQFKNQNHFNQSVLLEAKQPFEIDICKSTLKQLCEYHDVLRSKFTLMEGQWNQVIEKEISHLPFQFHDLSSLEIKEQMRQLAALKEQAQNQFILENGNLIHFVYFHFGDHRNDQVLWVMHHLICDGVSWRILLDDFCHIYKKLKMKEETTLPLKTHSFKTWGEFLQNRTDSGNYDVNYWLNSHHFTCSSVPIDFQKGPNIVESSDKQEIIIDEQETQNLLSVFSTRYRFDLQDVLLAILSEVFYEEMNVEHTLLAIESHGREGLSGEIDLSRTIGWFTSLYPWTLSFEKEKQFDERIEQIHQKLSEIPNKGVDYGLYNYLDHEHSSPLPLLRPQVCFNYLGQLDQAVDDFSLFTPLLDDRGSMLDLKNHRCYLLEINAYIVRKQLHVEWNYSLNFHLPETINRLAESLSNKIKSFLLSKTSNLKAVDFSHAQIDEKDLLTLLAQIQSAGLSLS